MDTRLVLHCSKRWPADLNGYVTRVRDATRRPVHEDDDGAVAETHKQRRVNPPEQPQRQPTLHDALKRAAAATASSADASADGPAATAAVAPQPTGAKRGPDTQTEVLHRPAASARITVSSPRPAPLAAAAALRGPRCRPPRDAAPADGVVQP